ncbi:hypothetical protein [uncultured Pelagimonas sp.]|uniref:hypothetical protein n=1 Tax=uncultured Pelagimonas sp. TaxID=1618102 RepID=UPI0026282FFF|nr:hypothetical protein [uncultured Pelagimonas sp.]
MLKTLLTTAILTGIFCAGFSVMVSQVAVQLSMTAVVVISFISGFLGSTIAQLVQKWRDARKENGDV